MRDKNDKTNDKRETIEFELFLALFVPGRVKRGNNCIFQVNTRWEKLHRLFSI